MGRWRQCDAMAKRVDGVIGKWNAADCMLAAVVDCRIASRNGETAKLG